MFDLEVKKRRWMKTKQHIRKKKKRIPRNEKREKEMIRVLILVCVCKLIRLLHRLPPPPPLSVMCLPSRRDTLDCAVGFGRQVSQSLLMMTRGRFARSDFYFIFFLIFLFFLLRPPKTNRVVSGVANGPPPPTQTRRES